MAQLPGAAFVRGRDRIVRVCDAPTRLAASTFTKGSHTAEYDSPTGATMLGLKGLITADYTPVTNNQEFFLLGDEGYRDSVGTSLAGDLACTAYFTLNTVASGTGAGGVASVPAADPALALILAAEHDLNKEVYVEVLTFMGEDTGSKFDYHVRAFCAGVADISESTPADGLLELSWTFSSRGQIYSGMLENASAKIDIYG